MKAPKGIKGDRAFRLPAGVVGDNLSQHEVCRKSHFVCCCRIEISNLPELLQANSTLGTLGTLPRQPQGAMGCCLCRGPDPGPRPGPCGVQARPSGSAPGGSRAWAPCPGAEGGSSPTSWSALLGRRKAGLQPLEAVSYRTRTIVRA